MNIKIEAKKRVIGKKSDMTNLRANGLIPAVIYGEGKVGINISLEKISFMKAYRTSIGGMAFFEINVEGEEVTTILKEKQVHPTSREFMHIDFIELHKGQEITVHIPITVVGDAAGVAEGGLLEVLHHDIEITCLPKDIPEEIVIDVTELAIGKAIHLIDLNLPENFKTSLPDATTFVAVRAPKAADVEESEDDEEEAVPVAE